MTIRVKVSRAELLKKLRVDIDYDYAFLDAEPVLCEHGHEPRRCISEDCSNFIPHRAEKHCPNCVSPPNFNCDCSCHTAEPVDKLDQAHLNLSRMSAEPVETVGCKLCKHGPEVGDCAHDCHTPKEKVCGVCKDVIRNDGDYCGCPRGSKEKVSLPEDGGGYIKFKNGIEVRLPKGWRFDEKFKIDGIICDGPLTQEDLEIRSGDYQ